MNEKPDDRSALSGTTALRPMTPVEYDAYANLDLKQIPGSSWYLGLKIGLPLLVGGVCTIALQRMCDKLLQAAGIAVGSPIFLYIGLPMAIIGGVCIVIATRNAERKP